MINSKILKTIGLVLSGLSTALLAYNFLKMYSLVGNCPNGYQGCAAFSQWQLINKVGIVFLVIGVIAISASFIVHKRSE